MSTVNSAPRESRREALIERGFVIKWTYWLIHFSCLEAFYVGHKFRANALKKYKSITCNYERRKRRTCDISQCSFVSSLLSSQHWLNRSSLSIKADNLINVEHCWNSSELDLNIDAHDINYHCRLFQKEIMLSPLQLLNDFILLNFLPNHLKLINFS